MIKQVLLVLTTLALTGMTLYLLTDSTSDARAQFDAFKIQYKKSYGSEAELQYRFSVFQETLARVNRNNADSTKRFTMAINKFADLKFSEFKAKYLNDMKKGANSEPMDSLDLTDLPSNVDWRSQRGSVGPVKNQEQCGSCWAFSTVASFENAVWRKSKASVSLSEQELVDCSNAQGNMGCNGGLMASAYDYIQLYQLGTETSYPYRAYDQNCSRRNKKKAGRQGIASYSVISPANVKGLISAASQGVVSVAIEVQDDFMSYSSGVYHNDDSCGDALDHGVAVVGYNTEDADAYFIVRNSWGPDWGADGYIKMAIETNSSNSSGTCGIANDSDVYPTL